MGLRVPTPLILVSATVCAPVSTWPGFRLFCTGPSPYSGAQGTWLCQGCMTRRAAPNLFYARFCVCMCGRGCGCGYWHGCVCVGVWVCGWVRELVHIIYTCM